MMKRRYERFLIVFGSLGAISGLVLWIFQSYQENLLYFIKPSNVIHADARDQIRFGKIFRLGGLVVKKSVCRKGDVLRFLITDETGEKIEVLFQGIPPNLFEEGKGAVAEGYLRQKQFIAKKILAKHDEKYTVSK